MPASSRHPGGRGARLRPSPLALTVAALGLALTATLSWVSYVVNDHSESRLLEAQTQQAGTVLQVVLPTIETPLASAAQIAATTHGDPASFRRYIAAYVGTNGPFVTATLWRVDRPTPQAVTTVGAASALGTRPSGETGAFLRRAAHSPTLQLTGPLGSVAHGRLGYAFAPQGRSATYAVTGESLLPANRRAVVAPGSPFADLTFALYLGRAARPSALLEANTDTLPIRGRTAAVVIPFGAGALTFVATTSHQLGGATSNVLWWVIAISGAVLSVGAGFLAERLLRRRRSAERLTEEVRVLLGRQRTIAGALQHALLPRELPTVDGAEVGARYLPGAADVEIGGDWYDVIPLSGRRLFFVVGDVSGRGVEAGSVMASLRFAARGLVSEGYPPERVLHALTGVLDISRDAHFATVLCGVADIGNRRLSVASAGHPPALLVGAGRAGFVRPSVGPPIGVGRADYAVTTVGVEAGTILLAYTDGLVERRGESLDAGLERLRDQATRAAGSLSDTLSGIVAALACGEEDDTAILGVRWLA